MKEGLAMEIETLKRNHLKRNIIVGIGIVLVLATVILTFTRAKYRTTQSIPLVNGTINYSLADLNIVAIKVDGEPSDTIPEGNYELTEDSYCTVDGEKDSSIKVIYEPDTKLLTVTPFTSKETKCYLYFEKQLCPFKASACNTILMGRVVQTRVFPLTISTTVTGSNGKGDIYQAEDDDGSTYYFAGNPNDNWVSFAGFYWRIIRINGDGSIRLIYSGDKSAQATGTKTQLEDTGAFNSNYERSEYVGLKYTINSQHGITSNSTILKALNTWYSSNLTAYSQYISTEAGFCGDREMANGYLWSATPSSTIHFAGYERLVQNGNNVNPTFKCNNSNDLYTVSSSYKGNHALEYPIGLITADEVVYGGLSWSGGTTNNYLYTGQYYWTMSPYCFYSIDGANVFDVSPNGQLSDGLGLVYWTAPGIRPVINLSANVSLTGIGTMTDPYDVIGIE